MNETTNASPDPDDPPDVESTPERNLQNEDSRQTPSEQSALNRVGSADDPSDPTNPVRMNIIQSMEWGGPLPPPQIIEQYERLVPGIARELFDSFLAESQHRRDYIDREQAAIDRAVQADSKRKDRGLVIAAILIGMAIIVAVLIARTGYPLVSGVIGGTGIFALVIAAILDVYERVSKRRPASRSGENGLAGETPEQQQNPRHD